MDCRDNDSGGARTARRWDAEYRSGRYEGEPPIPFANSVIRILRERGLTDGRGLYVGCGNGRNFAPLAAACPGLSGIDVSESGIRRLLQTHPECSGRVSRQNFLDCDGTFDYIVSIQAFQHGDGRTAARYIMRAASMTRGGGLLFLRVNSAGTDVWHPHHVIERPGRYGGFTVKYDAGPKKGLCIHFFTRCELESVLDASGFDIVGGPVEASMSREPPQAGRWRQWELAAARRGAAHSRA